MLQTLQMLQILQTPQQPQMLQIRYRFQTVLDWLVRLVRPEWQEWPECQRRRRRPKIREACFEVIRDGLLEAKRRAVLFARPMLKRQRKAHEEQEGVGCQLVDDLKLAALGKEKKGLLELCSSQITESRVLV